MSIFNIFKSVRRGIRMFFRRRMLPMTVDEAEEKREFFAKLYLLSSFSLFTFLVFSSFKQKFPGIDSTVPIGEATVDLFKIDGKVRIIKYEGFEKVEDYFYERKQEGNEENPENLQNE